ncbi:MAG: 50S ribosomal protein L4 [Bacilli bacterium]|nr:50S ribosomal protein L4 [Bacilli bacterium]MDD4282511.1 50S ribosomal protein L4 [Bacilli bacterium]MDD4718272.1 50S ribosomal protein L4 [Bacilli bacterium]
MGKTSVLNTSGEKIKDITLNEQIWAIEPNDAVLYDAIKLTRNSQRQGTHATKTRSEVIGGGRKPWRQKGTGRARHGSTRSPIWVGGGVTFGPAPRDYGKKMNRKEKRLALKSALAYKAIDGELIIVDNFNLESSKTQNMIKTLDKLGITDQKTLIVVEELTDNLILGTRNLKNIMLLQTGEINTLDIISADKMVITVDAVKAIEEVLI